MNICVGGGAGSGEIPSLPPNSSQRGRQVHGRVVNNGLFIMIIVVTYHAIYYAFVQLILIHDIDDIE